MLDTASRTSSLSASDCKCYAVFAPDIQLIRGLRAVQDRYRADEQDKLYGRERQWNKPNGMSPGRTPPSARRVSGGSPSFNTTIRPGDSGSPKRDMSRRASMTSLRSYGSRSSLGSSMSSNADCEYISRVHMRAFLTLCIDRERIGEFEEEKNKERERNWNKPRSRRASSSQSMNSPHEHSRMASTPPRPGSEQTYRMIDGRAVSWHSPGPLNRARADSPTPNADQESSGDSRNPVAQEREKNWNSPHPHWVYQVPRSMSPLPPTPPVPGSGYGRAPSDWDPNRLESPSRIRHPSLVNGRRVSYERSRTSSLSEDAPPKLQPSLHRAGTDPTQSQRSQPPGISESIEDDQLKEANLRFGWAIPKRRANLPPFQPDVESPQKRPSTPEDPPPSGRLSARPSLIPIRSPGSSPATKQDKSDDAPDRKRDKGKQRDMSGHPPPESRQYPVQRSRIEPIDLINTPTEDLVPTDIESGGWFLSLYGLCSDATPSKRP